MTCVVYIYLQYMQMRTEHNSPTVPHLNPYQIIIIKQINILFISNIPHVKSLKLTIAISEYFEHNCEFLAESFVTPRPQEKIMDMGKPQGKTKKEKFHAPKNSCYGNFCPSYSTSK